MVYGREGVFDADRLIDLLTALESFVDSANSARGDMDESTGLVMAGRQSAALPAPAGGGFSTVGDASGSSRQQPGACVFIGVCVDRAAGVMALHACVGLHSQAACFSRVKFWHV